MAFFANLAKTLFSTEGPAPNAVIDVPVSSYTHVPIMAREECLVLYGPTSSKNYELLLNKPVEDSRNKAFSLFRDSQLMTAQMKFISMKDSLLPLIEVIPSVVVNIQTLQILCDLIRDHSTWTVAHVAAFMGYVQAFAHPKINRFSDTSELDKKRTPLHIALEKKDVNMIRALLERNVSVDVVDANGDSMYHLAAKTNKNIIEILTKRQSKLMNAPNINGKTPLHLACESNNPDCVKALLCAGADVNVAATHDSTLPIHLASSANSTLCAKEIISMYPNQLNAEDMKGGGTPLHWATSKEMIIALVDLGCKINARNFHGKTALHKVVEHDNLSSVLALLSYGAEANLTDHDGCCPLHYVRSPSVLQALLVFRANINIINDTGENVRHIIATNSFKDKNKKEQKDQMLFILHAVGGNRCSSQMATCNTGCMPAGSYDGVPPGSFPNSRARSAYDDFLDDALFGGMLNNPQSPLGFESSELKKGRILCLDGGGLKGLVLIQLLIGLEEVSGRTVLELFNWISGTSTGGILALALAVGKSTRYAQGLYFRLKDNVFLGQRPYNEKPLEDVLKEEFGENRTMADIKDVKVIVTGVLADRFPADLHLFRNYKSGEEMMNVTGSCGFVSTLPPHQQKIWEAARASGAAPSYFKPYGRFIDGGLIGNNPTLDTITEIMEHNTVMNSIGQQDSLERPSVVVSLGTGRPPVIKTEVISVIRPDNIFNSIQMAFGLSDIAKLLIDQATMADNRTVDRARAWCGMCGIPYLRLSPQLSLDVQLDEKNNDILVNMLWETMVYLRSKRSIIEKIVRLL